MDHIPKTFNKVQITFLKYNFDIIPTEEIIINDGDYKGIVIMYTIRKTNNTTNVNEECIIPYYISDAHTNRFRTNITLPFMCYNNENGIYCPTTNPNYDRLPLKGLFKLNSVKNLDLDVIQRFIDQKMIKDGLFEEVNNKIIDTALEFADDTEFRAVVDEINQLSDNRRLGLPSVLKRIENIIDYFIVLSSHEIIMNDKDPDCYRPIFESSFEKFNMDNCEPNDTKKRMVENEYRKNLMIILNHQINVFIKLNVVEIDQIVFADEAIMTMNQNEFNQYVNVCQNNIENWNQKISIYQRISEKIRVCTKDFIGLQLHNLLSNPDTNAMHHWVSLNTVIKNESLFLPIRANITGWNARCIVNDAEKKYLKYKNKYLQLKKIK